MADAFSTVSAELPRDRWGRPLITPPDGDEPTAYLRASSYGEATEDTKGLGYWQQDMVALGMGRRPDLVMAASAITDPKNWQQKKTLKEISKAAMEASGGYSRATIGTALHSYSEMVDRGESIDHLPAAYKRDMAAYAKITEGFTVLAIETFVVCDELRVAGTFDRILHLPEGGLPTPDGEILTGAVIGDLKTGGDVKLGGGKIAQQMGIYANSVVYDHTTGSRSPLPGNPSKKWGIVIHLPAGDGQASLLWFNLEAGYEAAREISARVYAWRKRKDLVFEITTISGDDAGLPAPKSVVQQISEADSYDALRAIYAANSTSWTPGLNNLAAERRKALGA